jgi:uncharacterized membrane protein HdeD (DUF308 family)
MTRQFDVFMLEAPDVLAVHWGWPILLGCLIALIGIVAIWKANAATILSVGLLGALALTGAVAVLFFSFTLAGLWTEFFVHVLWAVVLGVAGLIMLTRPTVGAEAITLVIALYFLVSGIMTIGFALSARVDNLWIYLRRRRDQHRFGPHPACWMALHRPVGDRNLHWNRSPPEGQRDHSFRTEPARDIRGLELKSVATAQLS